MTIEIRIFLVCIWVINASIISACSCGELMVVLPVKEVGLGIAEANYRGSEPEIIFEGILIDRVFDSTRYYNNYKLRFEVTDVYKGACVDTLAVWTNDIGGACGFRAKEGSYSIVFAEKNRSDELVASRSDCWQGANQGVDPKRYEKYRTFLTSLKYGIDGDYSFRQKRYYWGPKNNDPRNYVPNIEYAIRNGQLHGPWLLYNRSGEIVESGNYVNGRRRGTWLYRKKGNDEGEYSNQEQLGVIKF